MIAAIAKFISALLDLPGLWLRWRSHRKDVKIEKLEVEIAKKDATVKVEHLQEEYAKAHEKTRKQVKDESQEKSLDDIADYFGKPS